MANRRGLTAASDAPAAAEPSGETTVGRVCLIDLDDVEHVIDRYGNDTGDLLLAMVGQRLESAVGFLGTVARSGGDEFVLLPPSAPSLDERLPVSTPRRP